VLGWERCCRRRPGLGSHHGRGGGGGGGCVCACARARAGLAVIRYEREVRERQSALRERQELAVQRGGRWRTALSVAAAAGYLAGCVSARPVLQCLRRPCPRPPPPPPPPPPPHVMCRCMPCMACTACLHESVCAPVLRGSVPRYSWMLCDAVLAQALSPTPFCDGRRRRRQLATATLGARTWGRRLLFRRPLGMRAGGVAVVAVGKLPSSQTLTSGRRRRRWRGWRTITRSARAAAAPW
jgi:hypothetical protein